MVPGFQVIMPRYSRDPRQAHKDNIANAVTCLEGKQACVETYIITEIRGLSFQRWVCSWNRMQLEPNPRKNRTFTFVEGLGWVTLSAEWYSPILDGSPGFDVVRILNSRSRIMPEILCSGGSVRPDSSEGSGALSKVNHQLREGPVSWYHSRCLKHRTFFLLPEWVDSTFGHRAGQRNLSKGHQGKAQA